MLPLEGLRILDLTRAVPGPYATMLLGDMGADVLMVEPPSAAGGGEAAERAAAFDILRRNKASICLDLKQPDGRAILHRLADEADVLIEGFRPGVVARLGADYDTLRARNDRLVYCSLSGYGQDGPYRDLSGHDINYIAIGGALSMIGRPGGAPAIPLMLVGDLAGGGLMAAFAILVALEARRRTGRGQYIDLAMSDGVVSLLSRVASAYFATGLVPPLGGHRTTGRLPWYDVYRCADSRFLAVGPLEPHLYRNLCVALDLEELASLNEASPPHALEQAREKLRARFLRRSRNDWFERLKEADCCVAPVLELDEVFRDPHHLARGMQLTVEHPTLGPVPQIGIAAKLGETPGAVRTPGPTPGAQTTVVLERLGLAEDEIERLRAAGAVG